MLRFVDSFDHYGTSQITQKWNNTVNSAGNLIASGSGRNGTNAFQCALNGGFISRTFDSQNQWTAGFAIKFSTIPNKKTGIAAVQDVGVNQCELCINADGTLSVTRNGNVLGTSATSLLANVYYYIEWQMTIASGTGGSSTVKVGGSSALAVTAANTQNTTVASANVFCLGDVLNGGGATTYYDDLYLLDTQTGLNTSFLGDVRVECLFPSGVGADTQWTPHGSASNWSCVDETTPDADTSYVSTTTVNNVDTYALTDLSSVPATIYGVQSVLDARKDDAGIRQVVVTTKSGASEYDSSNNLSLPDGYIMLTDIREKDPNGNVSWTGSAINALNAGPKLVT